MKNKLRHLGSLPPRLLFYLFDSLVRSSLLYGSDVWGLSCNSSKTIDKMFHWFIPCALKVKSTTSNVIVVGESGQVPPSVYSHINVLGYLERLQHLKPDMLVKQVYLDLLGLHNCGHNTWVTSVFELAQGYCWGNIVMFILRCFISKYVYWYCVIYTCMFVSAPTDPISWLIKWTRLVTIWTQ